MSSRRLRRICVFCGSSPGADPAYLDAAQRLGRMLAERGIGLVYGGASVGLMGAVAGAALTAGGAGIGVIPEGVLRREVAQEGLSDLRIVGSMHERKALMAELADAFIALPGGIGTLEEIFEVWTWAQLGMHAKPCALLDVAGYFASLLAFLDHAAGERFLRAEHRAMLLVDDDPARLIGRMARYEPPVVAKWIERGEG